MARYHIHFCGQCTPGLCPAFRKQSDHGPVHHRLSPTRSRGEMTCFCTYGPQEQTHHGLLAWLVMFLAHDASLHLLVAAPATHPGRSGMSEGHNPPGFTTPPYLDSSVWSRDGQAEEAPPSHTAAFQWGWKEVAIGPRPLG